MSWGVSQHQEAPLSFLLGRKRLRAGSLKGILQRSPKRVSQAVMFTLAAKPRGRTTFQMLLIQHTLAQTTLPSSVFLQGSIGLGCFSPAYRACRSAVRAGLTSVAVPRKEKGTPEPLSCSLRKEQSKNGLNACLAKDNTNLLEIRQISQVGQEQAPAHLFLIAGSVI